ncbi:transcriptional activator NhaR [Massilia sp. CCM 8734]|uniref:transcriptional activator NhaR n=1 Tax=Massilia sp. CCM 8734 TaxID=2609283 RepID=UPI001424A52F|nr:transcriptional activator NhaR [Massilia sp. CCM 8734]NIA00129.1 transcriptional activator NhaR [Massilia sp. CCM 8734]
MSNLNFKHLRYFWMVGKTGSIARAAEQLHLTPQSISGQLTEFASTLGVELFRRSGRNLELTDTGRRILSYAETIFNTGDELLDIVRDQSLKTALAFRVGCADSVSKLIACRLVEPALSLAEPLRLICREGRLASLLADLAVHRLDLIIADRPMPPHLSVKGYNHMLGESGLSVFATAALAATLTGTFPACLDRAPLLLPGEDFAIHHKLLQWLANQQLRPRIVGEFDDSAMMKAFGQSGAGAFFAPAVIARQVCEQYAVVELGTVPGLVEQVYAITTERRMSHPATLAISQRARRELFA